MSFKILVACLVLGVASGYERRVLRSLISTIDTTQPDNTLPSFHYVRIRRQAPQPPFPSSSRRSNDQSIPRIAPPPPGSILTYNGELISKNIGAYSIVPKSERKTPSINTNRPQYATYRGDLPPPIPDIIPRDLPQFKDIKSLVSNFPPGFQKN